MRYAVIENAGTEFSGYVDRVVGISFKMCEHWGLISHFSKGGQFLFWL